MRKDIFAWLCMNASPQEIRYALSNGAEWDEMALITAAGFNKNPEVLRILIDEGRKSGLDLVNMRSPINGTTPLHSAAAGYNENPEIVRLLIEAGAEINALDFYADTPLSLAIRTQMTKKLRHLDEIISILKDAGGM